MGAQGDRRRALRQAQARRRREQAGRTLRRAWRRWLAPFLWSYGASAAFITGAFHSSAVLGWFSVVLAFLFLEWRIDAEHSTSDS